MTRVGQVTGPATGDGITDGVGKPKNATSSMQVRLLQVKVGESLQTMQLVPLAGVDVNPPVGSVAVFLESEGMKFCIGTFDGVTPTCTEGEARIYSSNDAKEVLAVLKCTVDGKVCIKGVNGDLLAQLDNLMSALDTLLTSLTTFTTGLNPGTLAAQAATCAAALPAVKTSIASAKSAIDTILTSTE